MKAHWPSGEEVKDSELTTEQWATIANLIERHDNITLPVEIQPGMGGGYVGVMAGNMFIGVEPDGHSHT